MRTQGGKRTKIIVAQTAEEFESRLNKELAALDKQRTKYELQFNHGLGFCAYIISEVQTLIPETVEDEFELIGVRHKCIECPLWVHPTKGNVKYTRCEIVGGIRGMNSPCCEHFYQGLLDGTIEVEKREVSQD